MDLTPPPLMAYQDNSLSHARAVAEDIRAITLATCSAIDSVDALWNSFEALVQSPFSELPVPGGGLTLSRFSALSEVAATSLPLVKLYEAHTDAIAILREFESPLADLRGGWGVFAAEAKQPELSADVVSSERVILSGTKRWCSGASMVAHALVTARGPDNEALLIAVTLDEGLVSIDGDDWKAVGMALTATSTIAFHGTPGTVIARRNGYVERPGFWHGAVGIAACWYGAAAALAEQLRQALQLHREPHGLAHLGACASALHAARSALEAAATRIDQEQGRDARALALATRAAVEAASTEVLSHVGRALGARPFCFDAAFAARAADLPVYMRQSHAERDLAALGEAALHFEPSWTRLHHSL